METRTTLTSEQKEALYCKHLVLADEARTAGIHAEKKTVKIKRIKKLLKNKNDREELVKVSSGGKINIWKLPDGTYIVPSMTDLTHESPVEFIHISNENCSLSKCKEKKSKTHALTKKDQPLCLHTFLIHAQSGTDQTSEFSSAKKPPTPKLNRDLTVDFVISKMIANFPTMTEIESSKFVTKSRRYVEKLVLNKKDINQKILEKCPSMCAVCPNSVLEDWQFKAKKAFLISVGHLLQIEIPVKFCRICKTVFYPGIKNLLVISIRGIKNQNVKSELADCIFPIHSVILDTKKIFSSLGVHFDPPVALLKIGEPTLQGQEKNSVIVKGAHKF